MASRMMKTKNRRNHKKTVRGKKRKKDQQNKGTTPKFPIHRQD